MSPECSSLTSASVLWIRLDSRLRTSKTSWGRDSEIQESIIIVCVPGLRPRRVWWWWACCWRPESGRANCSEVTGCVVRSTVRAIPESRSTMELSQASSNFTYTMKIEIQFCSQNLLYGTQLVPENLVTLRMCNCHKGYWCLCDSCLYVVRASQDALEVLLVT